MNSLSASPKKIKALALLSGGLDSRLAIKLVREQGIEVSALNYATLFCTCTSKSSCKLEAQKAAEEEGIEVKVINTSREILEAVKNPKHGYGSGMNPCLDCRILMFGKAKKYMQEIGASFIVTGEVLGERPMSQRLQAIQVIEKESGLEGLILRPLSARLLKPSLPEERGWVDREKLLAIQGRSRKPQIKLAEELGLKDYPCPAGGCLLTDPSFAKKMRDLVDHQDLTLNNAQLLKLGRHFRIDDRSKVIVGRNDEENMKIISLAKPEDLLFELYQKPGPLTLLRGEVKNGNEQITAGLTIYHSRSRSLEKEKVRVFQKDKEDKVVEAAPLSPDPFRI